MRKNNIMKNPYFKLMAACLLVVVFALGMCMQKYLYNIQRPYNDLDEVPGLTQSSFQAADGEIYHNIFISGHWYLIDGKENKIHHPQCPCK